MRRFIPVVVHIVYKTQSQNLSDAVIQSQIEVLNEDFNRMNADAQNTPSVFQSVAANPKFQFKLACIDPNGNFTNGITRTSTNVEEFVISRPKEVQGTTTGGINPWSTAKYLNIWVCNYDAAGSAFAPILGTDNRAFDGIIVNYSFFGRFISGNIKGRVATHEVGHWLNCFHIFNLGHCDGTDFCEDTPNQQRPNLLCPSFPKFNNCVSIDESGEMFMNYMDYTSDDCRNLFTKDQKAHMRILFEPNGFRRSILENNDALSYAPRFYYPNQPNQPVVLKKIAVGNNPFSSTFSDYRDIKVDECIKSEPITWRIVHRTGGTDIVINGEQAAIRLTRGNSACTLETTIVTPTETKIESYHFFVDLPLPHYETYPNPAINEMRVEQKAKPNDRHLLTDLYSLRMFNAFNQLVRTGQTTDGILNFNIANLPRGIYQLVIETNNRTVNKRMTIQR